MRFIYLLQLGLLSLLSTYSRAQITQNYTFNYSGQMDSIVFDCGGTVAITAYGAQGVDGAQAGSAGGAGGLGAMASGEMTVQAGDVLYFFAGGQNGWNGGGAPGNPGVDINGTTFYPSGYGGDASDVRLNGTQWTDRILVAAGGGGGSAGPQGSCSGGPGGAGGNGGDVVTGATGGTGSGCGSGGIGGTGGTATSGGTGGVGNSNCTDTGDTGAPGALGNGGAGGNGKIGCGGYTGSGGGGGGGGYYGGAGGGGAAGGGGGAWSGGGGGGGSSFVGTLQNTSVSAGVNSGTGYINVVYTPTITFATIQPTSCGAYTSPSGNYTWTASGQYMDTIANGLGCDSIITIDLTVIDLDLTVTDASPTLMANQTGAVYQWLDCNDNFSVMMGETGQSFTAASNGQYAVEVDFNGCVDTSACYTIANIGLLEGDVLASVNVYPNPSNDQFTLQFGAVVPSVQIRIVDASGKQVLRKTYQHVDQILVDQLQEKGVYLLEINLGDETTVLKLIRD